MTTPQLREPPEPGPAMTTTDPWAAAQAEVNALEAEWRDQR